METSLSGCTILIVEDETLIALDIAGRFQNAGAEVAMAQSLKTARDLVERDGISAAIVDFGLGDGNANELCTRLHERRVPFVLHSGYTHEGIGVSADAVVPKPNKPDHLVEVIVRLLRRQ